MNEAVTRPIVVVTRPRAEAEGLAARLKGLGYRPLIEPLLEIRSVETIVPPLEGYATLAFTSANGARAFGDLASERSLRAYAVGPATEEALRLLGFSDIRLGAPDAVSLARRIATDLRPGSRVLHPSGRAVARDLAVLLEGSGVAVDRLIVYDAVRAARLSKPLVEAMYACTVHAVLFFSARTAETFAELASGVSLTDSCRRIKAFCLSESVADRASALPWKSITVPLLPTADAMIALLARGSDG